MKKPDLNQMYETFIRVPINQPHDAVTYIENYLAFVRKTVLPLIRDLRAKGIISWFCFLRHLYQNQPSVHLRFELQRGSELELPDCCEGTRKMEDANIKEVDTSTLRNRDIAEAWGVIGEGSDWVLKMLEAHSGDSSINVRQAVQFIHYINNALATQIIDWK